MVSICALLCVTACTEPEMDLEDAAQLTDHAQEIRGSWMLESYTADGEGVDVAVDVNTAHVPVLVFDDHVSGSLGCNQIESSFETPYDVENRILTIGELVIEAAECAPLDLMTTETVLVNRALWSDENIRLTIVEGVMIWDVGNDSFKFERAP